MKTMLRLMVLSAVAVAIGLVSSPTAFAQIPEVSTLPVVGEPLDVGGTILQPGTYQIRVVPKSNRNFVQVTSIDGNEVFATVLTVPHALPPTEELENTMFVYYPAANGAPRALRTWYAPNSTSDGGHDIVYPEDRAKQLARLANANVVTFRGDNVETAELQVVTPQATVETYVVPTPAPPPTPAPVITRIEEPEEPVKVAEARTEELPSTASNLPLVALGGLLALGAAIGLRFARQ
ncbi:MAG: hypothetical protein ACYC7A_11330 [Thermoanaerobaculia bacterium]